MDPPTPCSQAADLRILRKFDGPVVLEQMKEVQPVMVDIALVDRDLRLSYPALTRLSATPSALEVNIKETMRRQSAPWRRRSSTLPAACG